MAVPTAPVSAKRLDRFGAHRFMSKMAVCGNGPLALTCLRVNLRKQLASLHQEMQGGQSVACASACQGRIVRVALRTWGVEGRHIRSIGRGIFLHACDQIGVGQKCAGKRAMRVKRRLFPGKTNVAFPLLFLTAKRIRFPPNGTKTSCTQRQHEPLRT